MNATEPTQGKWEVTEVAGTLYVDAPGTTICMMMSGSPHNQDRVDAALICAAKDLREALDMCRCIIKFHVKNAQVCCSFSPEGKPFSALDAYKAAVEALDRAMPHE